MSRPKFSIVLIAKNEEGTLPRLLKSLAEFQVSGGEVVLLDTGSTDGTVNEARVRGCVVHEVGRRFQRCISASYAKQINRQFCLHGEDPIVHDGDEYFDYSAARNYAASLASNDFVWMPDCDEVFTAFDLAAIDTAIVAEVRRLEYNFVYCHDQYGAEAVKFLHSKAYNRLSFEWVGIIHEVLQPRTGCSQLNDPFKTVFIPEGRVKLEHFQNESTNRGSYLTGLALDCYENPDNDRNWHYFGRELTQTCRPRSAISVLWKHVKMNKWPAEAAQSMVYTGDCHLQLGSVEKAKECWHRAFIMDGSRREAMMRLATQAWKEQDAQRTVAYCAAALTIPWSPFYANDAADYAQRPHEMMYWGLHKLGDTTNAAVHWRECIRYQPLNPKYLHDGKFYIKDPALDIGEFTKAIRESRPFSFVKMGDGELACMRGDQGQTCDGQSYTAGLAGALRDAYGYLAGRVHVVHFDHQGDFNMLLHRDDQPTAPVVKFWAAVRDSHRPKAVVASSDVGTGLTTPVVGLGHFLNASGAPKNILLSAPGHDASGDHNRLSHELLDWVSASQDPIVVFCAGPLSKVLIADVLREYPSATCVDAGSSFDPIFRGQTRTHQLTGEQIKCLYAESTSGPSVVVVIPTLGRDSQLKRCMEAIHQNAQYNDYVVLVMPDSFTARQGCPHLLKTGVDSTSSHLVMYLGNDTVPQPGFMREAVDCMLKNFPDLDGLVGLNDGIYRDGWVATHWLAGRKLLNVIGDTEFFHTGYNHVGCDNELTARARKAGKYAWAERARIMHNHGPSQGLTDPTYSLGWDPTQVSLDRRLLAQRAVQLCFAEYLW